MVGIKDHHITRFGTEPDGIFNAPGRVNLIGEHTDYNDGYVLPTSIDRYLEVSIKRRADKIINLYSIDFDESVSYELEHLNYKTKYNWVNYVIGILHVLLKHGYELNGIDMCITGNIPIGVGLGSSAALEIATIRALNNIFSLNLTPLEAVYLGKECENNFVGVQSGIMDQFVSSVGEYGKALFIDCRSNKYSLHKISDDVIVVIVNSMVDRSLANSEYNTRYNQCLEAVNLIRENYPFVNALRDVTEPMLIEQWDKLPEVIARRARHVVTENQRVLDSIKLLERGDMFGFGELMYDSHDSLRHDYEVSSKYLDLLVEYTMDLDGVLGARLTGAGFGGCTVNLVETEYVDDFVETITERYFSRTAKRCEIYRI
jgi:galactokinase